MPLLLAESAKLSSDLVQRGVIETILAACWREQGDGS